MLPALDCSGATGISSKAAGCISGFKGRYSFPGPFFLRGSLSLPAFQGAPSGTKALIPLPDFHSRGRDEVHLCIRPLLHRKAAPADRFCQGTTGRHIGLPRSSALRALACMPQGRQRSWRRPRRAADRSGPFSAPSVKNPLEPMGTKISGSPQCCAATSHSSDSIPAAIIFLLLLRQPARMSACGNLAFEYERLFSNQCQVSE